MALIKDIKDKITGDAEAVKSKSCVENSNSAVEDNQALMTTKNVLKFIKTEIDVFDDFKWESTIEIPIECLDVPDYIILNNEKTITTMFHCKYCIKSFPLKYLLKNHLKEHIQMSTKTKKFGCKFCGKLFKLRFVLNRHIQAHSKNNF
ncbi:zinc finger protein 121-like [Melanaphis sacchari]|uniref:Protein ovo n=1 Tax=Melanaphis sacchari TaxID=742174 RepID=A0A2H8TLY7_9HEMI|nr:zinc finger protein 121-like [Melanaphis sacchari]